VTNNLVNTLAEVGFSKFPAVESRTAFVIDQIVQALRGQRYVVGDRLPSERVLAEQMGVGRAAVREALSALGVMGVIERRVGDGTYITSVVEKLIGADEVVAALQENKSLGEVWKARRIIEEVLAELAAQKANDNDLKLLENGLERIKKAVKDRDYEDYTLADRDFHLGIAKAAKNPYLMQALLPLVEITHQQVSTQVNAEYMDNHRERMVEEHRAVFHALQKRQRRRVVRLINLHFLASESLFLKQPTNSKKGE
jgi:DNA-binding FadR family transcriptional regulator